MPRRLIACALVALASCPSPVDDSWQEPFDASAGGWLLSVWGAPDDLWAVGGVPEPSTAIIMHRYEGEWKSVGAPPGTPLLNWVFGFGEEIFIAGEGGVVLHRVDGSFETMTTPTEEDLWGVWGSSPSDVWAVGGDPFPGGVPTVLHYDGTSWEAIETPELMRANVFAFFKVWGSGPDDVWVVGQRGAVLHYDGTEWTEELIGASVDMISLWGTGPDRIVVVGGRGNGTFYTYDGSSWQEGEIPLGLPGLNGVWVDEQIHVVGEQGTIYSFDFETREATADESIPSALTLHAIFGDGERLTTVGGNLNSPTAPFEGIARARRMTNAD